MVDVVTRTGVQYLSYPQLRLLQRNRVTEHWLGRWAPPSWPLKLREMGAPPVRRSGLKMTALVLVHRAWELCCNHLDMYGV